MNNTPHRNMSNTDLLNSTTAIIVNYNTGRETRRVVDEMREMGLSSIVVDNGEDDKLRGWTESRTRVQYIRTSSNLGYTGGNNFGIKQLKESIEYVLVVNPDISFPESFNINELIMSMIQNDCLKVLAPRVVNSIGHDLYNPKSNLMKLFALLNLIPRIDSPILNSNVEKAYTAPGSCLLIETDIYSDKLVFDERFFLYRGDVELCVRTLQLGWQIGIHENVRVIHEEPKGLRHERDYQMYYNSRNWFLLVRVRFHGWRRMVAYIVVAVSILSQIVKVARYGKYHLLYPLIVGIYDGILGRYGKRRYLIDP